MKLNKIEKNFLQFIGLRLSSFAINVLLSSVKIKIRNEEAIKKLINAKQSFVVAFWHGSMLIGWYLHRNMNCAALVSRSKDGDVLAHVLAKWGYNVVRGSSHIGGKEAMDLMLDMTKKGYSLALTPDGPTGPFHKMKAGSIVSAKKSKILLLLVGIGCKNKIILKSWDKFEIPKPFSRVQVIYSDPIFIDATLSYDETTSKIRECENKLNNLQKDALESCLTL